jgi:hypothetical protein
MVEQIRRELYFLTHATSVGAITSLAIAAIDTVLCVAEKRDWRSPRP